MSNIAHHNAHHVIEEVFSHRKQFYARFRVVFFAPEHFRQRSNFDDFKLMHDAGDQHLQSKPQAVGQSVRQEILIPIAIADPLPS